MELENEPREEIQKKPMDVTHRPLTPVSELEMGSSRSEN